jgi:hypothetical protein
MGIRNNQTPQNITPALILGLIGTIIIVAVLAGIFFLFWKDQPRPRK